MFLANADKIDLITRTLKATEHPLVQLFAVQKIVGIPRDEEAIADLDLWERCEVLLDRISADAVRAGMGK